MPVGPTLKEEAKSLSKGAISSLASIAGAGEMLASEAIRSAINQSTSQASAKNTNGANNNEQINASRCGSWQRK